MKNLAASRKDRLLALAQREGRDFNRLLLLYVQERLLARLAASEHHAHFVLKGGLLLYIRLGERARPTQDLDLLGWGVPFTLEALTERMRGVVATPLEDGVRFDPDSVTVAPIRPDDPYGGVRVRLLAFLGTARIPLQVDVGFGDALTPEPVVLTYPQVFEDAGSAILLWGYALETVVAEKFQAMVVLGEANSRLKDFYDVYTLSRTQTFAADLLEQSVRDTFVRRSTPYPEAAVAFFALPLAHLDAFTGGWSRLRRAHPTLALPLTFAQTLEAVRALLEPLMRGGVRGAHWDPDAGRWTVS